MKGIKPRVKNLTLASGIPEGNTVPLKTLLEAIAALRKAIRERAEGIEGGSFNEGNIYFKSAVVFPCFYVSRSLCWRHPFGSKAQKLYIEN
jgi:hypothetical protein